ncbi:hypothetical protein K431DRAFT_284550 [Polychaeton citri CBS 116435]|uniref:LYR motif-containing protein 2 n=1 Tax=Polychaeton citri CBS 116435 TaxID=1314669 RepID=A0A9P4Q9D9_9PEZI|nr:hypothetical protein K431DRAFT_284550 [Polychaeton citri CBS 116435]
MHHFKHGLMNTIKPGVSIWRKTYATFAPSKELKGKPLLTLEHFLQRGRALALWRDIIRAVHRIPRSATRDEMREFARVEFERYRNVHDLDHIRYLISTGKTQLDSMRRYVEQYSL